MPIWLALYLMIGCCTGTFYFTMGMCDFWDGTSAFVLAMIGVLLIALWPLWIGGALMCVILEWLGVI